MSRTLTIEEHTNQVRIIFVKQDDHVIVKIENDDGTSASITLTMRDVHVSLRGYITEL